MSGKPTFYQCPNCRKYYDDEEDRDPGDGHTLDEVEFGYGTHGWEQSADRMCGCVESGGTLHLHEFRAWLEEQLPDRVVGYARSDCDCPIARFLSRGSGGVPIAVSYAQYWEMGAAEPEVMTLPEWAKGFVLWIDTASIASVTAEAALRALGQPRPPAA